jgi:hypothetical protein
MILNDKLNLIREYIKLTIGSSGYLQSCFICSAGGLGKSTIATETLKEIGTDYVYINSYATPVELVNLLYKHSDKVILFDDTETMFSLGYKVLNIFKGVLWAVGKTGKRIVSYNTTSKLLTAPSQFEFTGKLVFLLNKLPNRKDPLVSALMSRSLVYEIKLSRQEILDQLKEYIKEEYVGTTLEERTELLNYLTEYTDNSSDELSFRTLIKMYDIFIQDKTNWKKLIKPLLTKDENMVLIKKLIDECSSIKEAQAKFTEATGLVRSSFYRIKGRLENANNS